MAEAGSATRANETSAHAKSSTSRTSSAKETAGTATTKTRARPAAKSAARTARSSRAKAEAKSPETTTAARRRAETHAEEGVEVPVPVLTPKVRVMHIPMPGMSYMVDAGRLMAGYLPPPERLAFYGGLGLAAVLGAIDWPVAAAIGVGTMIARGRGMRARPSAPSASGSRS